MDSCLCAPIWFSGFAFRVEGLETDCQRRAKTIIHPKAQTLSKPPTPKPIVLPLAEHGLPGDARGLEALSEALLVSSLGSFMGLGLGVQGFRGL